MASRIPLVLDETSNRLRELPNGDDLNLAGNNITGLISLSTTGGITVGGALNVTGESNANIMQATTATFTTMNATTVDATNFLQNGQPFTSGVQSDFNELVPTSPAFILNKPNIPDDVNDLQDVDGLLGGGFSGDFNDLINIPSIPVDIQDLTDNNGVLPDDIEDLTDTNGLLVSNFLDLEDTADTYTGQADKLITVNSGETGVGFIGQTELTLDSGQVTGALGFTPYDGNANANLYATRADFSGIGDISYDQTTGEFSFNNGSAYLTAEVDTLDSVTTRGGTTTNSIGVTNLTATGGVTAGSLSLTSDLTFDVTTNIIIDVNSGGAGGTLTLGGQGSVIFNSFDAVTTNSSFQPATGVTANVGSTGDPFDNGYFNTLVPGAITPPSGNFAITATGANSVLSLGAVRKVTLTAPLQVPELTDAQMLALASPVNGEIVYNTTNRMYMGYKDAYPDTGQWVSLSVSYGGEPSGTVHDGMIASSDGDVWDNEGDNSSHLYVYLDGVWTLIV
tara:strand:+ start:156 stop:1679 length:1524 start_codon:yes stop_codon:yes gene_type:complete